MTTPVEPEEIQPQPPFPARSTPGSNYVQEAELWGASMPPFTNQINQAAADTYQNALASKENADISVSARNDAQTAANSAVSSANFKGEWSTLVGALNIPASVSHNNTIWTLKVNLADVTASEPSVTNDWIATSPVAQTSPILNGQTLASGVINEVQSTIAVNAPISTTVIANTYIDIYVAKKYAPLTLTIDRQSTDLFEDNEGTDTQVILNFNNAGSYRIRSNGAGIWEV